jgi:hypothetical protein
MVQPDNVSVTKTSPKAKTDFSRGFMVCLQCFSARHHAKMIQHALAHRQAGPEGTDGPNRLDA